jgi:hypothetical protein
MNNLIRPPYDESVDGYLAEHRVTNPPVPTRIEHPTEAQMHRWLTVINGLNGGVAETGVAIPKRRRNDR